MIYIDKTFAYNKARDTDKVLETNADKTNEKFKLSDFGNFEHGTGTDLKRRVLKASTRVCNIFFNSINFSIK